MSDASYSDPAADAVHRVSILEEFSFLGQLGHLEVHPAESVLMREGEPGDCMYIIKRGVVEVTREGQLLALLESGEVIGEMALIDLAMRSATAVCAADCELIRIDRDQFMELARTNMEFFFYMMRVQSDRLRKMNDAFAMHIKPALPKHPARPPEPSAAGAKPAEKASPKKPGSSEVRWR